MTKNDVVEALRFENVGGTKVNTKCARELLDSFRRGWLDEITPCPFEFRPVIDH